MPCEESHPPLITAPLAAVKQELHDALTKAKSRGDAETQRNEQTANPSASLRLWGKSTHDRKRTRERCVETANNARQLRLTARLWGGLNAVDDTACAFWQANGTHLVPGVEFFFSPAT